MSEISRTTEDRKESTPPARADMLPLPAMAAISLYMLVMAGVILVGVVGTRHYPPVFLFFGICFIAASTGLLRLKRWAWALSLSAVCLLAVYHLWFFTSQHQSPALVQGLLNLVFFLYLVRTEVRERLR
jgi:hypothetical protein